MEEDIKILENVLETKEYGLCEITDTFYKVIENLLKRYKELEEENKKLKESETYLYDAYQDAGKKMFEYAEELEKKDKVIDEMVEIISNVTVPQEKCKECIKEYFYKKVE